MILSPNICRSGAESRVRASSSSEGSRDILASGYRDRYREVREVRVVIVVVVVVVVVMVLDPVIFGDMYI